MRNLISLPAFAVIALSIFTSASYADTLVFDNSNFVGYVYGPPSSYTEMLDYGTSPGGRVSKFVLGYTTGSTPGTIWIRFYRYTDYSDPGYEIKQFALTAVPSANGYVDTYEYIIPEPDRFELPSGDFGYSLEFSRSTTQAALATGGSGIDRYFWEYDEWYDDFMPADFGVSYNFYFQVYTAPPIDEVTCDISGYKFDDADADSIWDAGESALSGWLVYVDTNNNDQYDTGAEPNAVTDQTGMYLFENLDAPATYTIREVMQNGWTQTFPGGPDYEYSVVVEPNNVYGPYNFGNTDQPVTKYGGGDGTPGNPYKILTAEHMNQIGLYQEDWSSHFILMNDINMSGITGEQYNMIGYHNSDEDFLHFTGTFDGNNHTINYFSYETSSDQRLAGMFGYIENAQITDLTLTNATVSSNGDYVGALAGCLGQGTVINCHADASVSGDGLVGGLIGGAVQSSTVDQCSSSGVISGTYQSWFLGGLAGFVRDSVITNSFSSAIINGENEVRDVGGLIGILHSSSLANCYATGTVTVGTGSLSIGGLLGTLFSSGSTVEQCYSTGEINAGDNSEGIGGLIGSLSFGSLKSSYSTGAVSANASSNVGGLVGGNSGSIIHCYSRGNVTSYNESDYIGGFVGATWGEIFCCYSIGTISATSANNSIGGFSGRSFGVVNSFWDTQTSGLNYSVGGKERTTVQMQQIDNYINWNTPTETNWVIDENNDYPHLAWEGTAGTNLPTLPITDYLDGQGTSAQPFLIYDANALNVIGVFYDDWDKDYLLASNIDMTMIGGNEFNMIGTDNTPFSGSFDGNGYWIDNFLYSSMGSESNIGLFSVIGGIVNNLNFENASISLGGGSSIGVLAGHLTQSGIVENCYVQGNIETTMPSDIIGGVAGSLEGSMINCESAITITTGDESDYIGGLLGYAYSNGSVTQCGSVVSIATGIRCDSVGGLGGNIRCSVTESFAEGIVTAGNYSQNIGGLAGYCGSNSGIMNCYSKTSVSGGSYCEKLGGLIGWNASDIYYCYSTGAISAEEYSSELGGLVGYGSGSYRSYWDKETSGQETSTTGTGLSTEQMQLMFSYPNWNFGSTWRICDGMNYPRLQWEPKPLGDFVCPEGVELNDLMMLSEEWLAEVLELTADIAPDGGDGKVNLTDWAHLANAWMSSTGQAGWDEDCDIAPETPDGQINELDLTEFADQWLYRSARFADIAPVEAPDGKVDMLDYCEFAENWQLGTD